MRNFDQSSRTEESPVETGENPGDISLEKHDVGILEDTTGIDQLEKSTDERNVVDGFVERPPESTAATTKTSTMYSSFRSTTTVVKTSTTIAATPTTSVEAPAATTLDTTSGAGVAQIGSLTLLVLVVGAVSMMWFS
jgi:hypothetical protein